MRDSTPAPSRPSPPARSLPILERGMALHVPECPLRMREYNGEYYANVIDDCTPCTHFRGAKQLEDPEGDVQGYVFCDRT
jgi:hypothetical protein